MDGLKKKWEDKHFGTIVGSRWDSTNRITFAMFADDTTLVAKSKSALKQMIRDVRNALADIGLNVNPEKRSVQYSTPGGSNSLDLEGQQLPIVSRDVGFKVLGTMFTLNGSTHAEFNNRMRSAYAKFNSLYEVFGKRDASIQKRLHLFQATVTQSALWCSESWTLTVA